MVLADVLIISAWGLISPIFAIFVTDKIQGGSLIVVGIAEAIYLGTKSILQVPIGILIDKTKGEKIDFWLNVAGSLLMSSSVLLYLAAFLPWHIYLIGFVYGVGFAISYPAWMGLFTRNIESGRESFVWSLHSTPIELASALTAAAGGYLAEKLGFSTLFIIVFVIGILGTLLFLAIYPEIEKE